MKRHVFIVSERGRPFSTSFRRDRNVEEEELDEEEEEEEVDDDDDGDDDNSHDMPEMKPIPPKHRPLVMKSKQSKVKIYTCTTNHHGSQKLEQIIGDL